MSLLIFGVIEVGRAILQKNIASVVKPTFITLSALLLALLVNNTNLRLTADYVKDTQRGKSELAIKARQKKEKAESAERKRKEAIEEADVEKTIEVFDEFIDTTKSGEQMIENFFEEHREIRLWKIRLKDRGVDYLIENKSKMLNLFDNIEVTITKP